MNKMQRQMQIKKTNIKFEFSIIMRLILIFNFI